MKASARIAHFWHIGCAALIAVAVLSSCGDDKGTNSVKDWRTSDGPCAEYFQDDPSLVGEVISEIIDDELAGDGDAQDLDEFAQLSYENGLTALGNEVSCKAWLVRNPEYLPNE